MCERKHRRWSSCLVLVLIITLIAALLSACGDDGEGPSSPVITSGDQEPVKIGVLADWSGPFAKGGTIAQEVVDMLEKELVVRGGILGNRLVSFIHVDGYGTIVYAQAAIQAAARNDRLSALVGVAGGNLEAVMVNFDTVEAIGLPYFTLSTIPEDFSQYRYSVRAANTRGSVITRRAAEFLIDDLKPGRVAFLADDTEQVRDMIAQMSLLLKAAGVEIVHEAYTDPGVADFSANLLEIKQMGADVLMGLFVSPSAYMAVFRDINNLGGWGDTTFFSPYLQSEFGAYLPGAQGTYHLMPWLPESPNPDSRRFVRAFENEHGRLPEVGHFLYYTSLWTAIHAIELAGSDEPEAIAQAARSGDLVWDSPAGLYRIGTDGEHTEILQAAIVEDGKLVFVDFD